MKEIEEQLLILRCVSFGGDSRKTGSNEEIEGGEGI